MKIKNMRDKVYEYLVTNEPPVPEIGWHRHEAIFQELFPDAEHLSGQDLIVLLRQLVDDSRYQIGISSDLYRSRRYIDPRNYKKDISWLYGSSVYFRLHRTESWPIEIMTASELKVLKVLANLDPTGLGTFTLDTLAGILGILPESVRPNCVGQLAIEVVEKDLYRLAIGLDTPFWYSGEPYKSGRPNRLTSLRKEVFQFEPPQFATTEDTGRMIEAIQRTRTEGLALIESLQGKIEETRRLISQCDEKLKQLK